MQQGNPMSPKSGASARRLRRTAEHLVGCTATVSCSASSNVSSSSAIGDRYAAAWKILDLGASGVAAQAEITPHWETDSFFWYANSNLDGTMQFVTVDCSSEPSERRLASDQEIEKYNMASVGHQDDGTRAVGPLVGSVASTDGSLAAFVQDHNLWLRDTATGETVALSSDGTEHYDYATHLMTTSEIPSSLPLPHGPALSWSPCGRFIATAILDCRNCPQLTMVHSAPPDQFRPKYYKYFYPLPGDQRVPTQTPVVFDVLRRSMVAVQTAPFPCLDIDPPWTGPTYSWSEEGRLRYINVTRGYQRVVMEEADPSTVRTSEQQARLPSRL